MHQLELGRLWRFRQWRRLLNLVDNLPAASKTQEAISQDEEYAELIIRANKGQVPRGNGAPPLSTWTQEAALLASIKDEIAALVGVTVQANSKKGSSSPKREPTPRPTTAMERVATRHRLRQHDTLAGKLLGKRRQQAR